MNLQVTPEERTLLLDILQGRLMELRSEVHHASVPEFKEHLLSREQLLKGLIDKLQAS
jgi:hypothetical protein